MAAALFRPAFENAAHFERMKRTDGLVFDASAALLGKRAAIRMRDREVSRLRFLRALGLPVAKIHGTTFVHGVPAIVLKRYARASASNAAVIRALSRASTASGVLEGRGGELPRA